MANLTPSPTPRMTIYARSNGVLLYAAKGTYRRVYARTPSVAESRCATKDSLRTILFCTSHKLVRFGPNCQYKHRRVIVNIANEFRLGRI